MSDLKKAPCPTCGAAVSTATHAGDAESTTTENKSRPFCSERCRLADLSRWFGGDYAVPDDEMPEWEN